MFWRSCCFWPSDTNTYLIKPITLCSFICAGWLCHVYYVMLLLLLLLLLLLFLVSASLMTLMIWNVINFHLCIILFMYMGCITRGDITRILQKMVLLFVVYLVFNFNHFVNGNQLLD